MKNSNADLWTEDEVDLLMEDGPKKLTVKELSELIGRSEIAIRTKRNTLRNPDRRKLWSYGYKLGYYARHRAGKMKSIVKARWTAEEVRLITMDEQPSDVQLSNMLGRSVEAIQVKRSLLRAEGLQVI